MKKLLLLFSMMALAFNASADNYVTIDDVRVRPGSSADVVVRYHFDSELICAYQFDIQLPEEITIDLRSAVSGPTTPETFQVGSNDLGNGHYRFATFSFGSGTGNEPITDHEGVLLTFTIYATDAFSGGDASAYDLVFSENIGVQHNLNNVNFQCIWDDDGIDTVLDENDTEAPTSKNDANVKVIRSINANEWSTICLPFAMTEEQVKEAFGTDVQVLDLNSVNSEEDESGDITQINVEFSPVNAIVENHPYIIKISDKINEFTALHVNISPTITPNVRVGRNYMYGVYKNKTNIPNFSLFLSDNKFWYSNGSTTMKGFRGYFTFKDILSEVEFANSKINIVFDGDATAIDNINKQNANEDIYSVSGMNVGKDASRLQRGVYIVNGKKVVKK